MLAFIDKLKLENELQDKLIRELRSIYSLMQKSSRNKKYN